jgi:predicted PurR-regulated permease PerM
LVLGRSGFVAIGFVVAVLLLYQLRGVLTPIFLAFAIAYVLDPVVDRLVKWKIPRLAAIAIVLGGFVGAVVLFALLVVPDVVRDLLAVTRELPGHLQSWATQAQPMLERVGVHVPQDAREWLAGLQTHADKLATIPLAPVGDVVKQVVGGTFSAVGAVLAALIVPVLAVYLLYDFDRIIGGVRDLIPLQHRDHIVEIATEVDGVLSQFVRGQLTVMAILAVLYGGAYYLLGIRLAFPIGIAAGILNIVPYVGSLFALLAGILMSLIGGGGWWQLAGVVVAYAVVQTLEGFVITPKIVGNSVGLREVWVLLALFVGGEVFGFLGVLLAMPVAAVLKVLFVRAVASYHRSSVYRGPALALPCTGPSETVSCNPVRDEPIPETAPGDAADGEPVTSTAPLPAPPTDPAASDPPTGAPSPTPDD